VDDNPDGNMRKMKKQKIFVLSFMVQC